VPDAWPEIEKGVEGLVASDPAGTTAGAAVGSDLSALSKALLARVEGVPCALP